MRQTMEKLAARAWTIPRKVALNCSGGGAVVFGIIEEGLGH
jgi:hypothetical protein